MCFKKSIIGFSADNAAHSQEVAAISLRATPTESGTMNVASTNLLLNLPESCVRRNWRNFRLLQQTASEVYNALQENGIAGNQYIVVNGLSKHAIEKFANNKNVLGGIGYRFALEGAVGIIKIVPSAVHEVGTDSITRLMDKEFLPLGFSPCVNYTWAAATRHLGTDTSQKEPDQCLVPNSRNTAAEEFDGWPTLVIEAGVSESLPRLQADSSWWFKHSGGMTRFVIVIAIRNSTKKIFIQKWQLAPVGSPNPLTKAYIEQLRQTSAMAPLLPQPVAMQQAYCAQEIEVSVTPQETSVTGAPILLQSEALFDVPNQPDILLDDELFTLWAGRLFRN